MYNAFDNAKPANPYAPPSEARKHRTLIGALTLSALCMGIIGWFVVPPLRLQQLAQDTCDAVDGTPMIAAAGIVHAATLKAKRIGYAPGDLGDQMKKECPQAVRQMVEWAVASQE